jgi:hypothetical protein
MAVIISDSANAAYDGNLSTVNGFYRVEARNLGNNSYTVLALSTTRTQAVTFENAGNCQGIILGLYSSSASAVSAIRGVKVSLEQNTGSWAEVNSKTLTATEILGSDSFGSGIFFVPFKFDTPTAVTTDANTWRFVVSSAGSESNHWSWQTSNGTLPTYITWCDNQVSFTDGDVLVCMDEVVIDASCTFNGVKDGSATFETCLVTTTKLGTKPTVDNAVSNLSCYTPAAAYTVTFKGEIALSSHSAIRFGTSSVPIPYAQKLTLDFSTSDISQYCRIQSPGYGNIADNRATVLFYGEIPTAQFATLSQNEASSQNLIHINEDVDWEIGMPIYIGKCNGTTSDSTDRTITDISGKTITLSSNLSQARILGGTVIASGKYGIEIKGRNSSNTTWKFSRPANLVMSGIFYNTFYGVSGVSTSATYVEHPDITSKIVFQDSVIIGATAFIYLFQTLMTPPKGTDILRVHVAKGSFFFNIYHSTSTSSPEFNSGLFTMSHCRSMYGSYFFYPYLSSLKASITNNVIEMVGFAFTLSNFTLTFTDNYIWGASTAAVYVNAVLDGATIARNTYNKNATAIIFNSDKYSFGAIDRDSVFGDEAANTTDIRLNTSTFVDYELNSPTGNLTVYETEQLYIAEGSKFRITDYNDTAMDDRIWMRTGKLQRCNASLADTTVRTAGGSALRFAPNGTDLLCWEQNIPTGDIQGKTMNVNVWVKINAAAYYAGTHTNPTLKIVYDNGTEVSAVATDTTDWQQINVSFTPATTYGQITMSVCGGTDATTTDAYFYLDDVNIAYPAGVAINLGSLDIFANGLPVMPTIATMPSLAGVWDEPKAAHTTAGTYGAYLDSKVSEAGGGATAEEIRQEIDTNSTQLAAIVEAIPTTSEIATAVDAELADDFAALPTAEETADTVWDEQTSAHIAAGSFGKQANDTKLGVNNNAAMIMTKR